MSIKLYQRLIEELESALTGFSFFLTTRQAKRCFLNNRIAEIASTNKRPWNLISQVKQCKLSVVRLFAFKANSVMTSLTYGVYLTSYIMLQLITLLISLFQIRFLVRPLTPKYSFYYQRYKKYLKPALMSLFQILTTLLGDISSSS